MKKNIQNTQQSQGFWQRLWADLRKQNQKTMLIELLAMFAFLYLSYDINRWLAGALPAGFPRWLASLGVLMVMVVLMVALHLLLVRVYDQDGK